MRHNHSAQGLKHVLGGSLVIIVAILVADSPSLVNGMPTWVGTPALLIGGVLGMVGLYVLAGGAILMLRSRAYH